MYITVYCWDAAEPPPQQNPRPRLTPKKFHSIYPSCTKLYILFSCYSPNPDVVTLLCNFTWSNTLQLSCCGSFHFSVRSLTADHLMSRRKEMSPTNLLKLWHPTTKAQYYTGIQSILLLTFRNCISSAWFYTPVAMGLNERIQ